MANKGEWAKNIAKSLGRATAANITDMIPNTIGTVTNTRDALKSFKDSVKYADGSTMDTVKTTAKETWKKALSDIKSGNIYMKEESDDFGFGDDFSDDFDFGGGDFGSSGFDSEEGGIKDNTANFVALSESNTAAIEASTIATMNTIRSSTDILAKTNIRSAKIIASETAQPILGGIGKLYEGISGVNSRLESINANISKLVEQGNAYSANNEKMYELMGKQAEMMAEFADHFNTKKKSQSYKSEDDWWSGGLNIGEWFNVKSKKVKDDILPMAQMFIGMHTGDMSGMMGMESKNKGPKPINVMNLLTKAGMGALLPKKTMKALTEFDEALPNLIRRSMNRLASDQDNFIMSMIGGFLGIESPRMKISNLSHYNKNAVAWDGKSKKSLEVVIPEYLANIEVAVNKLGGNKNASKAIYDYDKGVFKSEKLLREELENHIQSTLSQSFSLLGYDDDLTKHKIDMNKLNGYIDKIIRGRNEKAKSEARQNVSTMLRRSGMSPSMISKKLSDIEDASFDAYSNISKLSKAVTGADGDTGIYDNFEVFQSLFNRSGDASQRKGLNELARFINKSKVNYLGYDIKSDNTISEQAKKDKAKLEKQKNLTKNLASKTKSYFGITDEADESYFKTRRGMIDKALLGKAETGIDFVQGLLTGDRRSSFGSTSRAITAKIKKKKYASKVKVSAEDKVDMSSKPGAKIAVDADNGQEAMIDAINQVAVNTQDTANINQSTYTKLAGKKGIFATLFDKNNKNSLGQKLKTFFLGTKNASSDKYENGLFPNLGNSIADAGKAFKSIINGESYVNSKGETINKWKGKGIFSSIKKGFGFIKENVLKFILGTDEYEDRRKRKSMPMLYNYKENHDNTARFHLSNKKYGVSKNIAEVSLPNGPQSTTSSPDRIGIGSHITATKSNSIERRKFNIPGAKLKDFNNYNLIQDPASLYYGKSSGIPITDDPLYRYENGAQIDDNGYLHLSKQFFGIDFSKKRSEKKADQAEEKIINNNASNFKPGVNKKIDNFGEFKQSMKSWGDTFKPNMVKYGVAGGALGLLGSLGAKGLFGLVMPGGPISGVIMGLGASVLASNETFKETMFGEKGEDGARKGGIISAKFQKKFKDSIIPAIIGGAAFGVAKKLIGFGGSGLLGATGIFGAAVAGAAVSLITKSETFQNTVFGNKDKNDKDGTKQRKGISGYWDKVTNAFQKHQAKIAGGVAGGVTGLATMTAISKAGTIGGAMGGPLGLIGGSVIGAALGIASKSSAFQSYLFGDDAVDDEGKPILDKNGKPTKVKNGLFARMGNLFKVDVVDKASLFMNEKLAAISGWFVKKIKNPLEMIFGDYKQRIKKGLSNLTTIFYEKYDNIKEGVKEILSPIGEAVKDAATAVFKPVAAAAGKAVNMTGKIAGAMLATPVNILRVFTFGRRAKEERAFIRYYLGKSWEEFFSNHGMENIAKIPEMLHDAKKWMKKKVTDGLKALGKGILGIVKDTFKMVGTAISVPFRTVARIMLGKKDKETGARKGGLIGLATKFAGVKGDPFKVLRGGYSENGEKETFRQKWNRRRYEFTQDENNADLLSGYISLKNPKQYNSMRREWVKSGAKKDGMSFEQYYYDQTGSSIDNAYDYSVRDKFGIFGPKDVAKHKDYLTAYNEFKKTDKSGMSFETWYNEVAIPGRYKNSGAEASGMSLQEFINRNGIKAFNTSKKMREANFASSHVLNNLRSKWAHADKGDETITLTDKEYQKRLKALDRTGAVDMSNITSQQDLMQYIYHTDDFLAKKNAEARLVDEYGTKNIDEVKVSVAEKQTGILQTISTIVSDIRENGIGSVFKKKKPIEENPATKNLVKVTRKDIGGKVAMVDASVEEVAGGIARAIDIENDNNTKSEEKRKAGQAKLDEAQELGKEGKEKSFFGRFKDYFRFDWDGREKEDEKVELDEDGKPKKKSLLGSIASTIAGGFSGVFGAVKKYLLPILGLFFLAKTGLAGKIVPLIGSLFTKLVPTIASGISTLVKNVGSFIGKNTIGKMGTQQVVDANGEVVDEYENTRMNGAVAKIAFTGRGTNYKNLIGSIVDNKGYTELLANEGFMKSGVKTTSKASGGILGFTTKRGVKASAKAASKAAVGEVAEKATATVAKTAVSEVGESAAEQLPTVVTKLRSCISKVKNKIVKLLKKICGKGAAEAAEKSGEALVSAVEKGIKGSSKKGGKKFGRKIAQALAGNLEVGGRCIPYLNIAFTAYDLISGLANPAILFNVNKDDVDGTMRVVSAILKLLLGMSPIGPILDVVFEVCAATSGVDIKCVIATFMYQIIMGVMGKQSKIEELAEAQAQFEEECKAYNEENGTNLSTYEYSNMQNEGMLSKSWRKTKNFFKGIGKAIGFGKGSKDTSSQASLGKGFGGGNPHLDSGITNGTALPAKGFKGLRLAHRSQTNKKYADIAMGKTSNGKYTTIGDSGCGPTSMSIVASNLTGTNITPANVAAYARANNWIVDGGSGEGIFTTGANIYGLESNKLSSMSDIEGALNKKQPVIVAGKTGGVGGSLIGRGSNGNSPYTTAGHIMAISGMNGNEFLVNDPLYGTPRIYTKQQLAAGLTNAWSYKVNKSKAIGYGNPDPNESNKTANGTAYTSPADGHPYYNQMDSRWNGTKLGPTASETVGSWGCWVTSAAMAMSDASNQFISPRTIIDADNGWKDTAISSDGNYSKSGVAAFAKNYGMDSYWSRDPETIKSNIQSGNPVALFGLYKKNGTSSGFDMAYDYGTGKRHGSGYHSVYAYGANGDKIRFYDPGQRGLTMKKPSAELSKFTDYFGEYGGAQIFTKNGESPIQTASNSEATFKHPDINSSTTSEASSSSDTSGNTSWSKLSSAIENIGNIGSNALSAIFNGGKYTSIYDETSEEGEEGGGGDTSSRFDKVYRKKKSASRTIPTYKAGTNSGKPILGGSPSNSDAILNRIDKLIVLMATQNKLIEEGNDTNSTILNNTNNIVSTDGKSTSSKGTRQSAGANKISHNRELHDLVAAR